MKTASIKEIKIELSERSPSELLDLCLKLTRFKKENKELLTYLLYEAEDEDSYIRSIKTLIDTKFEERNQKSFYLMKKSIRRILKETKKYIRYSKKTETEVELLIYFCHKLKHMTPSIFRSKTMTNMLERQIELIQRRISTLHEDLQYDYTIELENI